MLGGGADVVTDFTAGGILDKLTFVGMPAIATLADALAEASQVGANAVFDFGGGDTLTLNNVTLGDLTAADFAFGAIHGPNQAPTDISAVERRCLENSPGAVVGGTSLIPTSTLSSRFRSSDPRFRVISAAGAHQLTLKPGVFLDFETENTVGLDITATDGGGLSKTVHFTIDTLDSLFGLTSPAPKATILSTGPARATRSMGAPARMSSMVVPAMTR